jgi:hypothetical protein
VTIVESESEEFVRVTSSLEGFKAELGDLKESMGAFHTEFQKEKGRWQEAVEYLKDEQLDLRDMIKEKRRL